MNKCFFGDCRETMRQLIDDGVRVQTCVTSPPYWSLRDYNTKPLIFGNPDCEHQWGNQIKSGEGYSSGNKKKWQHTATREDDPDNWQKETRQGQFCIKCNAWYGHLGLEPHPDLYVQHIIEIFRLVRDLLFDDGTLWINFGDSYFGSGQGFGDTKTTNKNHNGSRKRIKPKWGDCGLKPKDLVMMPHRAALALQADGWWVRSDIIWNKPNPMPESCKDRPTRSHEYIFLCSKSARYYYDADAIKEPLKDASVARILQETFDRQKGGDKDYGKDSNRSQRKTLENFRKQFDKSQGGGGSSFKNHNNYFKEDGTPLHGVMANKRDVWTIPTKPYPEAHFATYPPELIEPCILAGSRVGDIVFDPFFGSGTTGQVAQELGRQWIGCELQENYLSLIKQRTGQIGMVFR